MAKNNKKKKTITPLQKANLYIQASFNNTIITFADLNGNVIAWSTSGSAGFKGTKKSTPFAAQTAMKELLEKVAPYQIKSVNVFASGVGTGRDAAFRTLLSSDIQIDSIKDVTPIAHNGVRAKKPRRA